jgi:hypothetical protein
MDEWVMDRVMDVKEWTIMRDMRPMSYSNIRGESLPGLRIWISGLIAETMKIETEHTKSFIFGYRAS